MNVNERSFHTHVLATPHAHLMVTLRAAVEATLLGKDERRHPTAGRR